MRRMLKVIGLGIAGLALAISLSLGAFALAGRSLGEPATAVKISESPRKEHVGHDQPSPSHGPEHQGSGSSTSPVDDHGGSSGGSTSTSAPAEPHDHGSGGDD